VLDTRPPSATHRATTPRGIAHCSARRQHELVVAQTAAASYADLQCSPDPAAERSTGTGSSGRTDGSRE
jgi:hypothetical protein